MKKIIFSVLALGLSMGVMAQKVMVPDVQLNGNEKLTVNRGETVGASFILSHSRAVQAWIILPTIRLI